MTHNMNMNRTTIVAEGGLLLELRSLAQKKGVSFSEIVRCALIDYVAKNVQRRRRLSFSGIGASGGKVRLSEKVDDLMFRRRRRAS